MKDFKVVTVVFLQLDGTAGSSKEYSYFTVDKLSTGDIVVVEVRSFMGLAAVTKVSGLTKQQREAATRFVITKVNTDRLTEVRMQHGLIQEIKGRLLAAKEAFEERRIYELLAKDDPTIAALLQELNNLTTKSIEE